MLLSAVGSVLSQSVSDIELIICDDGSENGIGKTLDSIKDSRVKLISFKENKGLAAALNACIDVASGKYIARQDDDDISLPGRFEKQTEYLENHSDIDFIGTNCELYSSGEGVYGERIMPKAVDKRSFLFNSPFIHGSMMFRREVFDKERYRTLGKNRKYEDYDLFMRLCADGFKSANLPEKLYRFHYDKSTRRVSFSMRCDEFKVRTEGFKRLGVMAEWDHPYITLQKEFEQEQIKVFAQMASKGYIYKGLKPVYWCPDCKTALAEAEIEYAEDPCHSIYVKFKVTDDMGKLTALGAELDKTYFVIWTTTTWTLPANVAICVGPNYEYSVLKANGEYYVMATDLAPEAMADAGITDYETVGIIKGSELEYMKTAHPFIDRTSLVIVGDHVTLESGTGCVHTAPGHGVDDFVVCRKYPEIPIVVPVDENGVLTEEAGQFAGLTTDEANKPIAEHLEKLGALFALKKIKHQYPHCWRCHKPIIFRATSQWFCSVDDFKDAAVKAAEDVKWYPEWGKDRLQSMVVERADWCISRQRKWGVPIPVVYCKECGKEIIDDGIMQKVSDIFGEEGSDAWFAHDAEYFLPEGFECPHCHKANGFEKETDIMDVWFDSGSSHAAVLKNRNYLKWPADVYLEGADQYRGWFQSSLLTSVAAGNRAPYEQIITHGWTVDGEGRKMSKSLGNGIAPQEIIDKYGADILRLWVASADYHADIRISPEILKQISDNYRKIRNTARYCLGNLYDFDPDKDMVANDELEELDKYALMKLDEVIKTARAGYDEYEYHTTAHALHNFCVVDMSNFYFDVLKNRLYTTAPDSKSRRAAQTVLYKVLDALTLVLTPILAFTCDEIWNTMKHDKSKNTESPLFK